MQLSAVKTVGYAAHCARPTCSAQENSPPGGLSPQSDVDELPLGLGLDSGLESELESGLVDLGLLEVGLLESGLLESGLEEGLLESGLLESGLLESGLEEGLLESGLLESGLEEGLLESRLLESGLLESGLEEGLLESGLLESGLLESGLEEGLLESGLLESRLDASLEVELLLLLALEDVDDEPAEENCWLVWKVPVFAVDTTSDSNTCMTQHKPCQSAVTVSSYTTLTSHADYHLTSMAFTTFTT